MRSSAPRFTVRGKMTAVTPKRGLRVLVHFGCAEKNGGVAASRRAHALRLLAPITAETEKHRHKGGGSNAADYGRSSISAAPKKTAALPPPAALTRCGFSHP